MLILTHVRNRDLNSFRFLYGHYQRRKIKIKKLKKKRKLKKVIKSKNQLKKIKIKTSKTKNHIKNINIKNKIKAKEKIKKMSNK